MRYYADLGMKGVAVKSPGDPQEEVEGWTYVEHPNRPLGSKWNRGLREIDDDVMIVGSDDFVSKSYIEKVASLIGDRDVIGLRGLYILQGRLYWCYPSSPGAGRAISRKLIQRPLWDDDINECLDASPITNLQRTRLKRFTVDEPGCVVLDVKTGVNIRRLENGRAVTKDGEGGRFKSIEERPVSELREHFPEWVIEGACSLTS